MNRPKRVLSILIRVKNAENDLARCLKIISKQVLPDNTILEIVIVDNESTDLSVPVARSFNAKILSIKNEDFSWGKALNLGISKTRGEIVLILSADAHPVDEKWLTEMIKPFENFEVAAVYGHQIPRHDAPIDEIIRLKKTFGKCTIVSKRLPKKFSMKGGGGFPVSNSCAAIRKVIWENEHYDEEISGGEEGIWTYNIFKKGYTVVYQASACVYHSHREKILRAAWRNLEIFEKNLRLNNKKMEFKHYCTYIPSYAKRRIKNVIAEKLDYKVRIKGLMILPFELLSIYFTIYFFHSRKFRTHFRPFFWSH